MNGIIDRQMSEPLENIRIKLIYIICTQLKIEKMQAERFESKIKVVFILFVLVFSQTGKIIAQKRDHKGMHSDAPAKKWQDALISGNGETGVLVYGNPTREKIIFNHEFCYEFIGTEDIAPPEIAKYLPEIRNLMSQEKYDEATKYAYKMAKNEGYAGLQWTDPYHPAMLMEIDQRIDGTISNYKRSVNFETGEISVKWTSDHNNWERNTFVSRTDNVVLQQFKGTGKINVSIKGGQLVPQRVPHQSKYGKTLQLKPSEKSMENNWMVFRQPYKLYGRGYEIVTKVIPKGGKSTVIGGQIEVTGADEIIIMTRIIFLEDFSLSQVKQTKKDLDDLGVNYKDLLKSHALIHSEIFNRVQLELFPAKSGSLSSEALIAAQNSDENSLNLDLVESMFNMGRYALISSSGKNPPNLMGIWNGEWRPAWSGDFTTDANINLQIASAAIGDLPEAIDSYMTMLERIMDDWETNAQNLYGARGYLAGTRTSGRRNLHTHFNVSFPGEFWLAGAEWLLMPCYEYYLVSGDTQFLKERLLPAMKKTVLFFEDFLSDVDLNGNYLFAPSYSPENSPSNIKLQGAANATMDVAAAKEAIQNLINVCKDLKIEEASIPKWEAMLQKFPPYLINKDGALKEWAIDDLTDNYDHRHISHLYPLWPGFEINPEEEPKMFQAARIAFDKKGRGNNSAHGLMHGALISTRLKEADKVYENLLFMLRNNYVFTSLFTSHNPNWKIYNADALHSLPAVILEMLVYSRPGVIELLPACSEKLEKGKITGVKCRTQATVELLEWDFKTKTINATISTLKDQDIELFFRKGIKSIEVHDLSKVEKVSGISYKIHLKKDKPLSITIKF